MRLLGNGELKTKVSFVVYGASKSAVAAVEKLGGSVRVLAKKPEAPAKPKGKNAQRLLAEARGEKPKGEPAAAPAEKPKGEKSKAPAEGKKPAAREAAPKGDKKPQTSGKGGKPEKGKNPE